MLSRLPKPVLLAMIAVVAGVALYAATGFESGNQYSSTVQRDPLAPAHDAPDVTAERGSGQSGVIDMRQVDRMASEKLGPMPEIESPQRLASTVPMHGESFSALKNVERIREIRRTQGSAAAVAALNAMPPLNAP